MKRYNHTANFVESYVYIEEDGTEVNFNFKASFDVFLTFKNLTEECLVVALDRYTKQQLKVFDKFKGNMDFFVANEEEKIKAIENEETRKSLLEGIKEGYAEAIEPHIYDCGLEFSDAVILSMYAAGLNENDKTEALAIGIECLPEQIYTDVTFFTKLINRLMKARVDLKKKGLLPIQK